MDTTQTGENGPNFSEIKFNDEIGQPTYVELIAVTRQSGQAIRTICDETTGELICNEGPPPSVRLRSLAYNKPIAKNTGSNQIITSSGIVAQSTKYGPKVSAQKNVSRSHKIVRDFKELISNNIIASSVTVPQAGDKFYFAFPGGIYVSNSINGGTLSLLVAGSGNAVDLAISVEKGVVYWCEAYYINDFNENAIYQANLDGSNKLKIAQLDFVPYGIWLDEISEVLYCTTGPSTQPRIVRLNTNDIGGIVEIGDADIPNLGLTDIRGPVNLEYNLFDSMIYYAGYGSAAPDLPGGIYKMNVLNGTTTKIVDTNDNVLIQGPSGVALVLDNANEVNSRLYFTTVGNSSPSERNSKIWRVKLDGTDLEILPNLPPDLGLPTDISYDPIARKLYITDTAYGWLTSFSDPQLAVIAYDIDSNLFEVILFNNQPNNALLSRRVYETQALTGIAVNYTETEDSEIPEPICGSNYTLINNAGFDVDRDGWIGATLDTSRSAVTNSIGIPDSLNSSVEKSLYDPIVKIEQIFTTLMPGYKARLEITFGNVERTGDPGPDSQLVYTMTPYNSDGVSLPVDGLSGYVGDIYQSGTAIIETTVPSDGIIKFEVIIPTYVNFTVQTGEPRLVEIDRIRLCSRPNNATTGDCEDVFDISSKIQWVGTPRQPVNFFETFIRYKLRDPDDPTKFGFVYQPPIKTTQSTGCDIWKQQGDGGEAADNPLASTNLVAGNITSVGSDTNWIWASSAANTTTYQNSAKTTFWPPETNSPERRVEGDKSCTKHNGEADYKKCIIESITIYKLINKIEVITPPLPPLTPTPNCFVQFDGLFISDRMDPNEDESPCNTFVEIYTGKNNIINTDTGEMEKSGETVGQGDIAGRVIDVFPKSVEYTFDSIAIAPGVRVEIYSSDNFSGDVLLDQIGPAVIYNTIWKNDTAPRNRCSPYDDLANTYSNAVESTMAREWQGNNPEGIPWNSIFPPSTRMWSSSNMHTWSDGSIRITCGVAENQSMKATRQVLKQPTILPPNSNLIDPIDVGISAYNSDPRTGSECLPDPASEFQVILEYKRKPTQFPKSRSFTQSLTVDNLYEQIVETSTNWYSGPSIGTGIPGSTAKWESFTFVLDTPSGDGIDQCSQISSTEYTGSGDIIVPAASMVSNSNFLAEPCIPSVLIETLEDGILSNDIQSIILPNPTGGSYRLKITINDDQQITEDIAYNATSGQLQVRIGALSNVGGTANVGVTGSGTSLDPFIIEFRDLLQAVDVAPITVDVSNLVGTANAVATTLRDGTTNERQKLTKDDSYQSYSISFNGATTPLLSFNASLNSIQAAVESLSTIGVGNISVTGTTSDRNTSYVSSIVYFDFIGDFAGQNVPLMTVSSVGNYTITTEWNGGGVDEIQEVVISATSGSFKLTFYDPSDDSPATTDNISWLSSATTLKESILSAISWLELDNIIVTKPANDRWNLRFTGNLTGMDIKQVEVDGSLLRGGSAIVSTLQEAANVGDKQRITLINATGGAFQLGVKNPRSGGLQKTAEIPYNATAMELQEILEYLPWLSSGDVAVSGKPPSWTVSFDPKFGNIERMLSTVDDLICDPAAIRPIPEPPYQYEISRPGLGSPLPETSPLEPLRDSANVYGQNVFQRDLFDPNKYVNGVGRTLLQLALVKNYNPDKYNPYLRSCDNASLSEVAYTRIVKTQESYVLISKEIDSEMERRRVLQYLATHPEILPMRFSWDCLRQN